MSSHREAPEISKDPVADSTDLYAFVSPDKARHRDPHRQLHPARVSRGRSELLRVRRRRPLRDPHRQQRRRRSPTSRYQFRFETVNTIPDTFLYNVGPIESLNEQELEPSAVLLGDARRRQRSTEARRHRTFPVHRATSVRCRRRTTRRSQAAVHAVGRAAWSSPVSGPRRSSSTSARSSTSATCDRSRTCTQPLGCRPLQRGKGVNSLRHVNVHSIAMQVPITDIAANGVAPTNSSPTAASVGIWTTASRQKARVLGSELRAERRDAGRSSRSRDSAIHSSTRCSCRSRKKDYWNASAADGGQAVRRRCRAPRARGAAERPLPGCVPEPGGVLPSRARTSKRSC